MNCLAYRKLKCRLIFFKLLFLQAGIIAFFRKKCRSSLLSSRSLTKIEGKNYAQTYFQSNEFLSFLNRVTCRAYRKVVYLTSDRENEKLLSFDATIPCLLCVNCQLSYSSLFTSLPSTLPSIDRSIL